MAKINVNDPVQLKTLRELLNDEDIFPFADVDPNDPNVTITIGVEIRKDGDTYPTIKHFDEAKDGKLSQALRKNILNELSKINPVLDIVDKMKQLGIEVVYGRGLWR